jgi:hypothetical protein
MGETVKMAKIKAINEKTASETRAQMIVFIFIIFKERENIIDVAAMIKLAF